MNDAYVNKVYQDGDKDIYFPYWRQILQQETANFQAKSLEKERDKRQFISQDEIALKHPFSGATVKCADDGSIELFVSADTGIRLDPKENSITFYGDNIHFASKEIKMHTKPYGLIWNNHNFNPYLYAGDKVGEERIIPTLSVTTSSTTANLPLFQEQTRKTYHDTIVQTLMNHVGIQPVRRS